MERLLVTGVDSPIGGNLALALADRCEVLGLYRHSAVESSSLSTACWQPADPESLAAHVARWQPDWIVHCGPMAHSSWDDPPGGEALLTELRIARQLAELAARQSSSLTVISSDAVFSGPRLFQEEQATTASSAWATQCRAIEQAFDGSPALVVRTHAYGWSPSADQTGFAEQTYDRLKRGQFPAASGRDYATPILATDLAQLLLRAHELRMNGLYHLAGAERTSRYRFVQELAAAMGLAPDKRRLQLNAQHAREASLSSRRARRMIAAPTPLLREGLMRFVEQAASGWRDAWQGASDTPRMREAA